MFIQIGNKAINIDNISSVFFNVDGDIVIIGNSMHIVINKKLEIDLFFD